MQNSLERQDSPWCRRKLGLPPPLIIVCCKQYLYKNNLLIFSKIPFTWDWKKWPLKFGCKILQCLMYFFYLLLLIPVLFNQLIRGSKCAFAVFFFLKNTLMGIYGADFCVNSWESPLTVESVSCLFSCPVPTFGIGTNSNENYFKNILGFKTAIRRTSTDIAELQKRGKMAVSR